MAPSCVRNFVDGRLADNQHLLRAARGVDNIHILFFGLTEPPSNLRGLISDGNGPRGVAFVGLSMLVGLGRELSVSSDGQRRLQSYRNCPVRHHSSV